MLNSRREKQVKMSGLTARKNTPRVDTRYTTHAQTFSRACNNCLFWFSSCQYGYSESDFQYRFSKNLNVQISLFANNREQRY